MSLVRPVLSMGGFKKQNLVRVKKTDVDAANDVRSLDKKDYYKMRKQKNPTKKPKMWQEIFKDFAPDSGWETCGLTFETLQGAWNMSSYNKQLLLDGKGNPFPDVGRLLREATLEYWGVPISERVLKKIVTEHSKTQGLLDIADEVMEHSPSVSERNYQFDKSFHAHHQFTKIYSGTLNTVCPQFILSFVLRSLSSCETSLNLRRLLSVCLYVCLSSLNYSG